MTPGQRDPRPAGAGSDLDLIRKHLPMGWSVDFRLTLVPDDGRPPKLLTADAIASLGEQARRVEAGLAELQAGMSEMVGYGDGE